MKLTTDIKPRRDLTITVKAGETTYKFEADENGMLVADVQDCDVGFLLDTGNFYPADEADIEAGIAAVNEQEAGGEHDEADIEAAPAKANKKKAK